MYQTQTYCSPQNEKSRHDSKVRLQGLKRVSHIKPSRNYYYYYYYTSYWATLVSTAVQGLKWQSLSLNYRFQCLFYSTFSITLCCYIVLYFCCKSHSQIDRPLTAKFTKEFYMTTSLINILCL